MYSEVDGDVEGFTGKGLRGVVSFKATDLGEWRAGTGGGGGQSLSVVQEVPAPCKVPPLPSQKVVERLSSMQLIPPVVPKPKSPQHASALVKRHTSQSMLS